MHSVTDGPRNEGEAPIGEAPASQRAGLWGRLAASETPPTIAESNLWTTVGDRLNMVQVRPQRIEAFELAETGGSQDARIYMLKNLSNGAYLQLTEPDVFLWSLMDGTRTVKALVIDFFVERKRYAPEHVVRLVGLLKANGLLQARHAPVFEPLAHQLLGRRWTMRLRNAAEQCMNIRLAFKDADGHFSAVYKRVGWLCYTRLGLLLGFVLFLVDIVLFPYYLFARNFSLMTVSNRYHWGFLAMLIVVSFSILAHEYAHALTSKHFGRDVNRAGFRLFFGLPVFYVDTTDMYMTRKWPRIAVSWAGPYTNMIIGGIALLFLAASPVTWPRDLIWEFATFNTLGAFSNLLPIVEQDGDYILMDMLEMPRLRDQSLAYLRGEFWSKLRQWEPFGRIDLILIGYSLLTIFSVVFTLIASGRLWLTSGVQLFNAALANPWLVLQIGAPVVVVAISIYIARFGLPRMQRAVNYWRIVASRVERG